MTSIGTLLAFVIVCTGIMVMLRHSNPNLPRPYPASQPSGGQRRGGAGREAIAGAVSEDRLRTRATPIGAMTAREWSSRAK